MDKEIKTKNGVNTEKKWEHYEKERGTERI